MPSEDYTLTLDLNVLNHLGINLYSNVPAVLSEVVANSWDAEATKVDIKIDARTKTITITDNGWGMSKTECNTKFLIVGYQKRDLEAVTTPNLHRHVMGRKGIGKLALFSIANIIEVQSVKAKNGKREKSGFVLDAEEIAKQIKSSKKAYHPKPIPSNKIAITRGTRIVLKQLKKNLSVAQKFLRKRLARRFSILGADDKFVVNVDGKPISVGDRDFYKKIEYLWSIGNVGDKYEKLSVNATKTAKLDGIIDEEAGYKISGWIGTFDEQKSIEEGNNSIVVLAWGKLIHEDLLKDLKEGGLFTKYLIGEIRADFLDDDDKEDIATTDRQNLKETDPRFVALKKFVQDTILNEIQNRWRDWRRDDATNKATTNPKVSEWFKQLGPDHRRVAKRMFQVIESVPADDVSERKELYRHGILAFESLALRDNVEMLRKIETERDFQLVASIIGEMDQLELTQYGQIVKGRFEVLRKFENIVPASKERLIQKHIFDHLWLLDPSWERASVDERMEQSVMTEFGKLDARLTPDEKKARLDIRYRTAAGKHIIIELKKYSVRVKTTALIDQVQKYRGALEKCLHKFKPHEDHWIETICIVGGPPTPDKPKETADLLRAIGARYETYDNLITQTRRSYKDYLAAQKKVDWIWNLVDAI